MRHSSPFHDIVAVEAWDAWFRWREEGRLRDVSVNDTWRRVARALSRAEPAAHRADFEQQLLDAHLGWRLLLDERILIGAGTTMAIWPQDDLVAVMNAAVFVQSPFTPQAGFRHEAFEHAAELAVRALDNAAQLATVRDNLGGARLRIGLIGLADALAQLRQPYDSATGRWTAGTIARSLARGCLRGSLQLATDRGSPFALKDAPALGHRLRELLPERIDDAQRHGLRHLQLTAISSQRRLALLANNVTDAIDPLLSQGYAHIISGADAVRSACSPGYALTLAQRLGARQDMHDLMDGLVSLGVETQINMRAAIQPSIDAPILYPLAEHASPETLKAAVAAVHG
jgi:ribonucleoside-diphosphate reductase alpha chain